MTEHHDKYEELKLHAKQLMTQEQSINAEISEMQKRKAVVSKELRAVKSKMVTIELERSIKG
jgi:predicted  nucleic acid-binding Zn-ribbon protein